KELRSCRKRPITNSPRVRSQSLLRGGEAVMTKLQTVGARLRTNGQDPLIRRHVVLLFVGKAIGLGIVLTLITRWFLPAVLGAQAATPAPALDPMAAVNAINTVWTLVAAFLVFGMQV